MIKKEWHFMSDYKQQKQKTMIDFRTYDLENPLIWAAFKKYSFEAKAKGFDNYSANGIFEIIRWNTTLEKRDKYKVNNNYRPDYARKMMTQFPEFQGFFRTRVLKARRSLTINK